MYQYRKLLLYYYKVIRGHLLLASLPSITISFIIQNQSSIFQLISYQVTTLKPFYIKSSNSFLYQLLRVLLLSQCVRGIIVLHVLVSILASYIYILSYLLGYLPNRANLLVLLFLFLRVLLLYFLLLLGLFRALRYLLPIVLTILQLMFLFSKLASIPLTSIRFSSISLTSIILRQIVSQYSFRLYFNFSLSLLSLLASYASPFLLYIGLGPNIVLFFFYFLYLFL